MHAETLRQYQLAVAKGHNSREVEAIMLGPHHFHISAGIVSAVEAIGHHEFEKMEDKPSFPASANLPASEMLMTIAAARGPSVVLLRQRAEDIVVISVNGGVPYCMGSFYPGTRDMRDGSDGQCHAGSLAFVAFCLSLLNEPRRVTVSPAGGLDWTRQHRKLVQRLTGRAALAYSVVSWQVGAGVNARGNKGGDTDLKVALHWCRGHWRRADAHHPRSEWIRPHAGAKPGWFTWVRDCWKGHPDHGIKLQRHEPRMVGEKRERGGEVVSAPSAEKLAAMSAQQRHALVEAGFAPTATVQ